MSVSYWSMDARASDTKYTQVDVVVVVCNMNSDETDLCIQIYGKDNKADWQLWLNVYNK